MKKMEEKCEQILKIMEKCVEPHKYGLWFPELRLMKVDEEMKAVFVSTDDPFKGAYIMSIYGEKLDKAAETVLGTGYKVYVTYDKERRNDDDFLSVRDNEFTIVTDGIESKHRIRMLFLTNTDVDDDEVFNVLTRMQDCARRQKAMKTAESLLGK